MVAVTLSQSRHTRSRAYAIGRELATRWVLYAVIGVGVVYTLFPVLWMLSNSFKDGMAVFNSPPIWIVTDPVVENYLMAFGVVLEHGRGRGSNYIDFMINSIIVGMLTTILSVAIGTLAGYALARFRYPGSMKFHLSFWILSTRMIPPIVTILPLFIFFMFVGLVNTKTALVIAYTAFNLPFVVWMMRGYFQEIPRELEESAMVDGDTGFGAFFRIVLPLARPGLAATAMFTMILSWNEFLFALILTDTRSAQTLPAAVAGRIGVMHIDWAEISAVAIIALMPLLIAAFALQRHLVRGLSFGAVRG